MSKYRPRTEKQKQQRKEKREQKAAEAKEKARIKQEQTNDRQRRWKEKQKQNQILLQEQNEKLTNVPALSLAQPAEPNMDEDEDREPPTPVQTPFAMNNANSSAPSSFVPSHHRSGELSEAQREYIESKRAQRSSSVATREATMKVVESGLQTIISADSNIQRSEAELQAMLETEISRENDYESRARVKPDVSPLELPFLRNPPQVRDQTIPEQFGSPSRLHMLSTVSAAFASYEQNENPIAPTVSVSSSSPYRRNTQPVSAKVSSRGKGKKPRAISASTKAMPPKKGKTVIAKYDKPTARHRKKPTPMDL